MEKKWSIVIKALPDLEDRSGVYVVKPNGEWDKYEYKDVRGKVDAEGKYIIVLAGKEFHLINKLRFPQREWKKDLYYDIFDGDEIEIINRNLKQLNNRELTRLIKHRWLVYNEINNQEIEVRVDRTVYQKDLNQIYCHFTQKMSFGKDGLIDISLGGGLG